MHTNSNNNSDYKFASYGEACVLGSVKYHFIAITHVH